MVRVYTRALLMGFVLGLAAEQVSQSSMLNLKYIPTDNIDTETRISAVTTEATASVVESDESAYAEDVSAQVEPYYRVYRVTAYCDRGTTAAGVPSGVGQCAAPADIPFGARIYIPELDRTFIVTDRTAKRFRHNTVDLYIPDRAECLRFGRHYYECEITHHPTDIKYASKELREIVAEARKAHRADEATLSSAEKLTNRSGGQDETAPARTAVAVIR